MSTEQNKEKSKKKVDVKIKSVDPYIIEILTMGDCLLCRNSLEETCPSCKAINVEDTSNCPIVEGKCGHKFHQHCIYSWLREHNTCPYPECGCHWQFI